MERQTILIVDDAEMNRMMLCDMLGDQYDYVEAADGREALRILEKNVAIDLVLLDIKALDPELCVRLTGRDGGNTLATLDWCEESGKPVWIRHVLVPGLTLDRARLEALAAYLEPYRCIGKVELLPFHKMADFKWKALGLENRLADTPEPEAAALREAESLFSGRSRDCRQP